MRLLARSLATSGLLCLVALACSQDPATSRAPVAAYQRLELRPIERIEPAAARVVARLTVPRELRPWRVEGAEASVTPLWLPAAGEALRALRFEGRGRRSLSVPGPLGGGTFSEITLPVHAPAGLQVEFELVRRGQVVLTSGVKTLAPSLAIQTLQVDLPRAFLEPEPFDGLRLVMPEGGTCVLGPFDLVDRPLAERLPPFGAEPPHHLLGEDSRPALGLWSARPLRAEFDVPKNARLVLAADHLRELGPPAQLARIEVEVSDARGRQTRADLALLHAEGAVPRWKELALDLAPHAGQRVVLELRLAAPGPAQVFARLTPPALRVPREDPPTVLLLTSDSHRFDHVGAHPAAGARATPTLDALAAVGVSFEYGLGTSNQSAAAHLALFSGRLEPGSDAQAESGGAQGPTLAQRFRERGWQTLAVLSAQGLGRSPEILRGFERALLPTPRLREAEETIASAREFLPEYEGLPLFLWVHLADARAPYEPPVVYKRGLWPKERGHPFDTARPALDLPERVLPRWLRGLRDLDYPRALYLGEILALDTGLAALVAEPRIAGGWIAFTASHGESLGEHGVYFDHVGLEPEVLRVPLILVGPGLEGGRSSAEPATQLDLGRTLLDLTGLRDAPFPGRSLLAATESERAAEPCFARTAGGEAAAVLRFPWLYVRYAQDLDAPSMYEPRRAGEVWLHDLSLPTGSARRTIAEEPQVAGELGLLLDAWLAGEPAAATR